MFFAYFISLGFFSWSILINGNCLGVFVTLVLGSQLSLNSSSVWEWSMKGDSTGSASLYALQVGRSIGHRRTVKEAEPVSKWMTPREGRQE